MLYVWSGRLWSIDWQNLFSALFVLHTSRWPQLSAFSLAAASALPLAPILFCYRAVFSFVEIYSVELIFTKQFVFFWLMFFFLPKWFKTKLLVLESKTWKKDRCSLIFTESMWKSKLRVKKINTPFKLSINHDSLNSIAILNTIVLKKKVDLKIKMGIRYHFQACRNFICAKLNPQKFESFFEAIIFQDFFFYIKF